MFATATRAVRYRRHRAGLRRTAVAVRWRRRRAAISAAARPDVIAAVPAATVSATVSAAPAAPAAVSVAIRSDVPRTVAPRDVSVVAETGHTAAESRDQYEPGACEHQTAIHGAHFASPSASASFHSMTPNGAPEGSAITASLPPWRSTCGGTSALPPKLTALVAVYAGNATGSQL